jgi:CubicO group peptidase (beta-lactamase class C family)
MKNIRLSATAIIFLSIGIGTAAAETEIDASVFNDALQSADDMDRLRSLLVSHEGDLVLEEYFNGSSRYDTANVKSVSKSVLSALVGIAIDQGHVGGLDQPIADYFGDRLTAYPDKGEITIGNLLSMQAGLETTSFYNFGAWVLSDDWIGFALERPFLAEPGTRMLYSTGNSHLLSAILTQATGMSTRDYAQQVLGEPLGINVQPWTRDPDGIYFGGNNMEFTPRQMLSFGEMYLNGGQANGRQVVPEDWVDVSLTPVVRSTRNTERQYGYGWWMRDMAGLRTAYAWGYGGQFILLVPDLGLVVVTTSSSLPGDTRRSHIRNLYNLLEHKIVEPAVRVRQAGDVPAG